MDKGYENQWDLNGVIIADLSDEGTIPVVREEWIMEVIKGDKEDRQAFTKVVGRGSSWQVLDFDFKIRSGISIEEGRLKCEREWEKVVNNGYKVICEEVVVINSWWILSILSRKNCIKELQNSVE